MAIPVIAGTALRLALRYGFSLWTWSEIGSFAKSLVKPEDPYVKSWSEYLDKTWGINPEFSKKAARLILEIHRARLRFTITSGYRSPETQQRLVDEWRAGNKAVYTPLPPGQSWHNHTNWLGQPDALAIDIWTSYPPTAGYIARQLGLVWGGTKDPVHFALYGGRMGSGGNA